MIDENKLIKDIFYVDGKRIPDIDCAGEPVIITFEELYKIINNQSKVDEWITVEERLPDEYTCIDDETGYYKKSDEVLCFRKSDYNDYEYWIDFTIDGEWQCSDYYVEDKMYWMPLPNPYGGNIK